jgi:hypothetical protein
MSIVPVVCHEQVAMKYRAMSNLHHDLDTDSDSDFNYKLKLVALQVSTCLLFITLALRLSHSLVWTRMDANLSPAWCETCVCGRTFSLPQAYTCHQRSCQKSKKRLVDALERAKAVWQAKKRRKIEDGAEKEALALAGPSNIPDSELVPNEPPVAILEVRF